MKKRFVALAVITMLASPNSTGARVSHHQSPLSPRDDTGGEYYTNVSGQRVHRPVRSFVAPQGASAQCRDGSWSFSQHHRGTCSHHGGVGHWQ